VSLPFVLGRTPTGERAWADLAEMPHLLVAGTTGSGKSVFLNSLIVQLADSDANVRFLLVDPKRVEFSPYRPFLRPYFTPQDMVNFSSWLCDEMDERYDRLERRGVRDLDSYNAEAPLDDQMARIVCVIDELANIMLDPDIKPRVEVSLTRVAQMARAVGIHLVLATQRPTVNVVTGLLRANIPARVAFNVITETDSRIILDEPGAENLNGKGDMLVRLPGLRGLSRLQGELVTIDDVEALVRKHTEVRG
jgi:S-DNA-T family DNA segregation ATPase FtsK/SpoIIIE